MMAEEANEMNNQTDDISPKFRLTATLLAVFLGVFGIHRLYLGKTRTGAVMMALGIAGFSILGIALGVRNLHYVDYMMPILSAIGAISFFVAVGIWSLVDFIIIVSGKMRDSDGKLVKQW